MVPVQLCGSSAVLRDWREGDLDVYARWLCSGHEWQRLDGPYYSKPDESEVEEIISRKRKSLDEPGDPREDLVITLNEGPETIGRVSRYWESRETNWLCVGIVIFDPKNWGRGLGYEALELWSDYLFVEMPELARLDLRTWSGNAGMMALARKLGYREEARFRKARIVDGSYFDGMGYGVLREEWEAMYPEGFSVSVSI